MFQPKNEELKRSINKKLSVIIPEVLKVSDDPKVFSLVVDIAAHLPPKAVLSIRSVTATVVNCSA